MSIFTRNFFLHFLLVVCLFIPLAVHSENSYEVSDKNNLSNNTGKEEFDAGKFVIEHVLDSYEWHIATIRDKHISVPLPVVLYTSYPELHNNKRLHIFMSSRFQHGNCDYLGFRISKNEENKGKIVELDNSGNEICKPIDLSITKTVAGIIISVIVLFLIMISAAHTARQNRGKAPSGIQNLIEPIVIFIRDEVAKPSIGGEKYQRYLPQLLTLFFFILLNNLLGLIPIFPFGANVTGNIAVTMVLALFTFAVTNIGGSKYYWKDIFNPDVPTWLKVPVPLMPILEIMGMFTKPFVLMVRLFANMLAGHLIITVFLSLIFIFGNLIGPFAGYAVSPISITFSVFMMLLDVLVSFIQAYVFTLLSALYFGMSSAEEH